MIERYDRDGSYPMSTIRSHDGFRTKVLRYDSECAIASAVGMVLVLKPRADDGRNLRLVGCNKWPVQQHNNIHRRIGLQRSPSPRAPEDALHTKSGARRPCYYNSHSLLSYAFLLFHLPGFFIVRPKEHFPPRESPSTMSDRPASPRPRQ